MAGVDEQLRGAGPPGGSRPVPSAALSSARAVVVPTATTRRPAARVSRNASAVAVGIVERSAIDAMILDALDPNGLERAVAHVQRDRRAPMPAASSASSNGASKCSPAVGAATDPRARA